MFTNELILKVATELAQVRKDNESEGSEYFQLIMSMLENNIIYSNDFEKVIEIANTL